MNEAIDNSRSRPSLTVVGGTAMATPIEDLIPPGIRATLRVLAEIHDEVAASRTNTGQGEPEHATRSLAPAS